MNGLPKTEHVLVKVHGELKYKCVVCGSVWEHWQLISARGAPVPDEELGKCEEPVK